MTDTHALTYALGPALTAWLDAPEQLDQAWEIHQLIAANDQLPTKLDEVTDVEAGLQQVLYRAKQA